MERNMMDVQGRQPLDVPVDGRVGRRLAWVLHSEFSRSHVVFRSARADESASVTLALWVRA